MNKDMVVIVGCGITGCVLAREFAEAGKKVIIYERRNHVSGNMYDYVDNYGIRVQKYGPHIFHTKEKFIYDYITKWCQWEDYKLICGAVIDGECVPTAFNFTAIDSFWDKEKAELIKTRLREKYIQKTVPILQLLESEDIYIREFAEFLFEKDYKPYTAKQWGIEPDRIDKSILNRVPVRLNYESAYFDDEYQVMPCNGYTDLCEKMLNHENITVKLNEDGLNYIKIVKRKLYYNNELMEGKVFYTGAIDELFGYQYGYLPYRSLRFEWKHEDRKEVQKYPVVAYPQKKGFTRITEYNKLPYQKSKGTTYAVEYPLMYESDSKEVEPYYPVLTAESAEILQRYQQEVKEVKNLICCGRLADFKYYNMDESIKRAIEVVEMYKEKSNE